MRDSDSEITFEMNAFYPQSPAVPITNPPMNNNPRKRNKARRDLGLKSCDVMRDSDSEIISKMNAFYPQLPAMPFAIPSMKNNHDPRKRNKARRDLVSKSCDVMRDSDSEIISKMNAFYPQAFEKNRGGKKYISRGEK